MTMPENKARVVVAAERAAVRNFLGSIAEQEEEATIVGEAADTATALSLARELKPDAVIVDANLPHVAGLDAITLSRIGGLDAAQTISEELPETTVILLNNLDEKDPSGRDLGASTPAILTTVSTPESIPLAMESLHKQKGHARDVVFASVRTRPWEIWGQKQGPITDKVIFFGALTLAVGWLLILTMFLLPVGIFIASGGAATVVLGFVAKLIFRSATGQANTAARRRVHSDGVRR